MTAPNASNGLSRLAEFAPCGLFTLDSAGLISCANPQLGRMAGKAPEDLIGRALPEILTRASQVLYSLKVEPCLLSGVEAREILVNIAAADGPCPALLTLEKSRAGDAWNGALFPAPERKAFEREIIAQRQRAEAAAGVKTRFLANISHELRTPLIGIVGMAALLERGASQPEDRRMAAIIAASARDLEHVLDDVLEFSKEEFVGVELELRPIDIGAVVRSLVAEYQVVADTKGVGLSLDIQCGKLSRVQADENRLRQIFRNLISNALKFTETGEVRIVMRTGTEPAEMEQSVTTRVDVVFEITDTGIGFDMADIGRIFAPFEQADSSITRKFGGTGLGLSIVNTLVQSMGGQINVTSSPGDGSIFTIIIPLAVASEADGHAPAPLIGDVTTAPADEPETVTARVLCAEDNARNQLVIRTLLEHLGVEVEMVGDGKAAVDRSDGGAYDLILMDIQMPVLDGLTATRLIRKRELDRGEARTPVIILSANVLPEHVSASISAGADLHLGKPITPTKLFEALTSMLNPPTAGV